MKYDTPIFKLSRAGETAWQALQLGSTPPAWYGTPETGDFVALSRAGFDAINIEFDDMESVTGLTDIGELDSLLNDPSRSDDDAVRVRTAIANGDWGSSQLYATALRHVYDDDSDPESDDFVGSDMWPIPVAMLPHIIAASRFVISKPELITLDWPSRDMLLNGFSHARVNFSDPDLQSEFCVPWTLYYVRELCRRAVGNVTGRDVLATGCVNPYYAKHYAIGGDDIGPDELTVTAHGTGNRTAQIPLNALLHMAAIADPN